MERASRQVVAFSARMRQVADNRKEMARSMERFESACRGRPSDEEMAVLITAIADRAIEHFISHPNDVEHEFALDFAKAHPLTSWYARMHWAALDSGDPKKCKEILESRIEDLLRSISVEEPGAPFIRIYHDTSTVLVSMKKFM